MESSKTVAPEKSGELYGADSRAIKNITRKTLAVKKPDAYGEGSSLKEIKYSQQSDYIKNMSSLICCQKNPAEDEACHKRKAQN